MSESALLSQPSGVSDREQVPLQNTWLAHLELNFDLAPENHGRTRLFSKHRGPLRIQKALYPEGDTPCHAIIIHPPGGIAAGDHLHIDVSCQAGAHALVTTPGAAKWYGSTGQQACQRITMKLAGNLEWLPQETIIFNRATVQSDWLVSMEPTGSLFGWDTLIFGRAASGESYTHGQFQQSLQIEIDQQLVWNDRLHLLGADALFVSPIGLRGHHALATCWAISNAQSPWQDHDLGALRSANTGIAWTTLHPRLLVGRALGSPSSLREQLRNAWSQLRPRLFGLQATPPRIWAT